MVKYIIFLFMISGVAVSSSDQDSSSEIKSNGLKYRLIELSNNSTSIPEGEIGGDYFANMIKEINSVKDNEALALMMIKYEHFVCIERNCEFFHLVDEVLGYKNIQQTSWELNSLKADFIRCLQAKGMPTTSEIVRIVLLTRSIKWLAIRALQFQSFVVQGQNRNFLGVIDEILSYESKPIILNDFRCLKKRLMDCFCSVTDE